MARPTSDSVPPALRALLAAIFLFGVAGTSLELILLDHDTSATQRIPLVLMAMAPIALAAALLRPSPASLALFRTLMIAFLLSGLLGTWFHYQGSAAFQREIAPSLAGFELFRKAIRSKAPPALAPGTMIVLGLIGLAFTYRQPGRTGRSGDPPPTETT